MESQHERLAHWLPCLYDDLLTLFPGEAVSIRRDKKACIKALTSGSLDFFTKHLPRVHTNALRALERGLAPPGEVHLKWLLDRVWDHPDSCEAAFELYCHRQISHILYKMELPYEAKVEKDTLDRFLSVEDELARTPELFETSFSRYILGCARSHLKRVVPPSIRYVGETTRLLRDVHGLTPKHGPGAVATGEKQEDKWDFKRLYASLHQRFPYYDWFMVRGTNCLRDRASWYRSLEHRPTPCAKVVLVPKDSRGPRIISEEPLELQYMQQAYFRWMCRWANHPATRGHISFQDQSINGSMALESSKSREFATLDLKDASDRVSVLLIGSLFPSGIRDDLMALRSTHTLLPDGRLVRLLKFAPMGSSVCFPTLAFTVWALACAGLDYARDLGEWDGDSHSNVFIFGDDVIVPTKAVESVKIALKAADLRVNADKSYSASYFRESCGVDAYFGVDITPVRIRKPLCQSTRKDQTYLSYLSYVNSLRSRGWLQTASALQNEVVKAYGDVAFTWDPECSPGILVDRSVPLNRRVRWSSARSAMMVRTEIPVIRDRRTRVNGWERLLRDTLGAASESPDREDLLGSFELAKRWVKAIR